VFQRLTTSPFFPAPQSTTTTTPTFSTTTSTTTPAPTTDHAETTADELETTAGDLQTTNEPEPETNDDEAQTGDTGEVVLPGPNPVVNSGFEEDLVPPGFNFLSQVSYWSTKGGPITIKPVVGVHVKELPEGTQMALLPSGTRMSQDVAGVVFQEQYLYTLRLQAAARLDTAGAGIVTMALARPNGQVLASKVITSAMLLADKGRFTQVEVALEVPKGAFFANERPRIVLLAGNTDAMTLIDNVILIETRCTLALCPLALRSTTTTTITLDTTTSTTTTAVPTTTTTTTSTTTTTTTTSTTFSTTTATPLEWERLALSNSGFELPETTNVDNSFLLNVASWQISSGVSGVFRPSSNILSGSTPSRRGDQVVFLLQGACISQTVPSHAMIAGRAYHLIVGVGSRADIPVFGGATLSLRNADTNAILTSTSISAVDIDGGDMLDFAASFVAGEDDAGHGLTVLLCNAQSAGAQVLFDHVRVMVGQLGNPMPTLQPGVVGLPSVPMESTTSTTATAAPTSTSTGTSTSPTTTTTPTTTPTTTTTTTATTATTTTMDFTPFPVDVWPSDQCNVLECTQNYVDLEVVTAGEGDILAMRIADLDGDGRQDVIAGTPGGALVFLNRGLPQVERVVVDTTRSGRAAALAVHNNGDGTFNLAVSYTALPEVVVYNVALTGGALTFAGEPIDLGDSGIPFTLLEFGDLNLNGYVDLVGSSYDRKSTFRFNGKRGYQPVFISKSGKGIDSAIADVDGNGQPDYIVGDERWNRVLLYSFKPEDMAPSHVKVAGGVKNVRAVAVADVNNDGKADVLFGQRSGKVSAILSAAFPEATEVELIGYNPNLKLSTLAVRDINGDGHADIVVGSESGLVLVYQQVLDGEQPDGNAAAADAISNGPALPATYAVTTSVSLPGYVGHLALEDMDGDGDADIVVSLVAAGTGPSAGSIHVVFSSCCQLASTTSTTTTTTAPATLRADVCPFVEFEVVLETENSAQSNVVGSWSAVTSGDGHPFAGSSFLTSSGRRSTQIFIDFPLTVFPSGFYRLAMSYVPAADRSSGVVYQILRNGVVETEVTLDQTQTPEDAPFAPLPLIAPVRVSQGEPLIVRVATGPSSEGVITADALLVGKCAGFSTALPSSSSSSSTTTTTTATQAATTTVPSTEASTTFSSLPTLYRINCGGGAFVHEGVAWSADDFFFSGLVFMTPEVVSGSTNPVYQSERYAEVGVEDRVKYSFPVNNGRYLVRMHFAEIYDGANQPGERLFDVRLEKEKVLENIDLVAEVGYETAVVKEFETDVADGELNLNVKNGATGNAKINGIEVIPL
jgi:hypothetical protein